VKYLFPVFNIYEKYDRREMLIGTV